MTIELKVPTVGESITEVQIGEWLKGEGDFVEKDQPVVEIESDKATVELPAPASGKISKVIKRKGERATVGEVIGQVDEAASAKVEKPASKAEKAPSEKKTDQAAENDQAAKRGHGRVLEKAAAELATAPTGASEGVDTGSAEKETRKGVQEKAEPWVVPAARRALTEHGLKPQEVQPSGRGGRLLKKDVDRYLERAKAAPASKSVAAPTPKAAAEASAKRNDDEIVPLSPLRRRVAERLVQAQQTAALLTTFNEVDMAAVMALRQKYRDTFQERYGVKLGFTSFFVKAVIEALKQFPQVNAEIRDDNVVYHNYFDIGIAVGGGKGLVVPVVRAADRLSFAELEKTIADFGQRARDNKIKIEELQGGTFTISNGGVYGSLLSTPIVNPPQSGILGLHAIQDRPVAREGQVVIRPMMYIALTYDHRLVDGREAVLFLRHIKELIEEPSRILLEI